MRPAADEYQRCVDGQRNRGVRCLPRPDRRIDLARKVHVVLTRGHKP
ncbi:MAG: hypothetical protein QFE16_17060 [Pseudomonadota bacterium]|nr:hypothetical protein [Pseudomonadota bacterium]